MLPTVSVHFVIYEALIVMRYVVEHTRSCTTQCICTAQCTAQCSCTALCTYRFLSFSVINQGIRLWSVLYGFAVFPSKFLMNYDHSFSLTPSLMESAHFFELSGVCWQQEVYLVRTIVL